MNQAKSIVPVTSLDQLRADLMLKRWADDELNSALLSIDAADQARIFLDKYELPQHPDRPKNWDNLISLYYAAISVEQNSPILDAGAGKESAFLPGLQKLGFTDLTGINLLHKAPEEIGGVKYQYGDVTATDFEKDSFEFVACLSVLEHGVDLKNFLEECRRIIRPGGFLFVSVDYWSDPIDASGKFAFGVPVHIFSRDEINKFVEYSESLGFELVGRLTSKCGVRVISWLGMNYTFLNLLLKLPS